MNVNRFRDLSILLLATFCVSQSPALATQAGKKEAAEHPAYCSTEHLEVRQIALDTPGMSQTHAFFVVLNRGPSACTLRAGPVRVWSNDKTSVLTEDGTKPDKEALYKLAPQHPDREGLNSAAHYTLPPVPADGKMALKDLVGFSVGNSGASGTGDWFTSLSVQLPDVKGHLVHKTYRAEYQGYASFPIQRTRFVLEPFLSWSALEGDGCTRDGGNDIIVGQDSKGSDIPDRTIDVRHMLQCG